MVEVPTLAVLCVAGPSSCGDLPSASLEPNSNIRGSTVSREPNPNIRGGTTIIEPCRCFGNCSSDIGSLVPSIFRHLLGQIPNVATLRRLRS